MNKHFITEKDFKFNWWRFSITLFISTISLMFLFSTAYDFFSLHYNTNRLRLLKYLKKKKVIIGEIRPLLIDDNIKEFSFTIDETPYVLWLWNDENISLASPYFNATAIEYIGLFESSFLTRKIIKKIITEFKKFDTDGR